MRSKPVPSEMQFIPYIPKQVPNGHILVHSNVAPQPRIGMNGFRIWLSPPDPNKYAVEVCECGWAPHLLEHYRVKIN